MPPVLETRRQKRFTARHLGSRRGRFTCTKRRQRPESPLVAVTSDVAVLLAVYDQVAAYADPKLHASVPRQGTQEHDVNQWFL